MVFCRAQSVAGSGRISASGGDGVSSRDGASGGGAGGTVSLSVSGRLQCAAVESRGGNGGNNLFTSGSKGTGGGGAGGVIEISASSIDPACTSSASNGLAGSNVAGSFYGAEPTQLDDMLSNGRVSFVDAGALEAQIDAPDAGLVVGETGLEVLSPQEAQVVLNPVRVVGLGQGGDILQVDIDGTTAGAATVLSNGTFSFDVPELSFGDHRLRVRSQNSVSEIISFRVRADPQLLKVGCACSGDTEVLWLFSVLLWLRRVAAPSSVQQG